MAPARLVLAMDIGGTKLAVALVDGARLVSHSIVATPAAEGPEAVLLAATGAARTLLREAEEAVAATGAACAGFVQEGRVRAMSPELLPGWHGYPLVDRLAAELKMPAFALNDAQAAAYGEALHGAGRGRGSILFVTVSTGVGGGLVLGDRLWGGATGLAGHIGHVRRGELERFTSGTAIARRAAEAGHRVDARVVLQAAEAGSSWAATIVREAAQALVDALVDVKLLLDPEAIVLGGGVGLNPIFRQEVNRLMADAVDPVKRVEVVAAELAANAGLVGAASWARIHSSCAA